MSENENKDEHVDDHADGHAGHFIIPWQYYGYNFAAITILMTLTVMFGKMDVLSFGDNVNGVNLWIALGIAVAKAGCIIAIFMGVKWSTPIVKVFALGVLGWLTILFVFFLVDYASPSWGLGTPYSDYYNPGVKPLPPFAEPVAPIEAAPAVHE